ncbi:MULTISPECIES: hypothetical protein [unclassified Microcoleus]|uniref:hypothetical protein n=1 Tax=unclassified Microcoleus TaxID=2642155 RepID=UPI002FD10023
MVQHLSKSYIAGRLCFGMSIAPMPATPNAGWETSSRLTATGGQNLVFLFDRPNYPNQQLKSPPAVR